MTDVFLSFLEISIPINFIIAVLLLLTPFLNKRYAAKWKYWIWIVLALRLIIPLGGNSKLPVGDRQPQVKTITPAESEKTPSNVLADGTARGRVIVEIPTQMTTPIVTRPEKSGSNISMLDIIAFVWMLGSLFFISVHLVSYFHYKHQILKKGKIIKDDDVLRLLLKLKHELRINRTVSVMEYSEADSPLLIGFCNPVLVLPKEQYNSEELFFILKHELVHLKRGDIYLKLLFAVANAVHWFNPLIWIMQKEASVDMELSCDERVTQGADYATRKAYTETLLSALHKQSAKKTVLSTGFYGGKQIMKKRFKNILAKKRKKNGAAVLICAIMLAVSLGTLVGCTITKEKIEEESGSLGIGDIPFGSIQTNEPSPSPDNDSFEAEHSNRNYPTETAKSSADDTKIQPEPLPSSGNMQNTEPEPGSEQETKTTQMAPAEEIKYMDITHIFKPYEQTVEMSFQMPEDWEYTMWDIIEESPDWGYSVKILGRDDAHFRIYGQFGTLTAKGYSNGPKAFQTSQGLTGQYYWDEDMPDGENPVIYGQIVFDRELLSFYGVSLRMPKSVYSENKDIIDKVFQSIVIKEAQ